MPGRKPTAKDLEAYEAVLKHMRGIVTGDLTELERDAFGIDGEKAGVDAVADSGSDSYYQEFSLELIQMDENSLREIDAALKRLREGTYGKCLACGKWIAKGRLLAVPHARNCIECQRAQESA